MTERPDVSTPRDDDSAAARAERRRRLDRIFGDPLPDATTDERSDSTGSADRDADLRRDVPPHHHA